MKSTMNRRAALGALGSAAFAGSGPLWAQNWPQRPVRIVVPIAPGGAADANARMVAERLSRALGQQVFVENKPGGAGNVGIQAAKSAHDGHTFLFTGNNYPVNVTLLPQSAYQLDDFVPVIELARGPSVLVASPNAAFGSLRELIDQARASPGRIAYGSPGIGVPSHIACELFQYVAKIKLLAIQYRGSGPALLDAVAGQIPLAACTLAAAMPHIKAGKLKALAVTSSARWESAPDIPTVTEIIQVDCTHLTWHGILAPRGTPADVVALMNAEINKVLEAPALREALASQGMNASGGTPQVMGQMILDEYTSSKELIKAAGIKAE
ncbi:MAG: tripartite tricarboxylate transporter substrate binding protein [Ottowia sp.]|uniref:tripartite tricarboxylate transporter substrate binding protein n=1 Tax=Ottowia sp. TaxID=1898956 RepID=UPI0039E67B83